MSFSLARLAGRPVKRVFGVIGLCLFVMIASVIGSYYVMRAFLFTHAIHPAPQAGQSIRSETIINDRLAGLEGRTISLTNDVAYLRNSQNGQPSQDHVTEGAVRELVQAHLFEQSTKRVGDTIQVTPFSAATFLNRVAVPTTVWDSYPVHELHWSGSSRWSGQYPWELYLSKEDPQEFALVLRALSSSSIGYDNPELAACDEKKYSDRVRQAASYFHAMYPDEDVSVICAGIEVSAPIKGGDITELDPKTNKQVPVVVRAYIYRPKKLRTIEGYTPTQYATDQPLATALVMRENTAYWPPSVFEWVVATPLYSRYDGFISEAQLKTAQKDVGQMLKTFTKEAQLFSGFCGYGDCY